MTVPAGCARMTVPAAAYLHPLEHHSKHRVLLAEAIRRGIEDAIRIGGHGEPINFKKGGYRHEER